MSAKRLRICKPWVVGLTVLTFLGALPAPAQNEAGTGSARQQKIAALKQSLAQNQAALKQYSWTETTQVSFKGEVKKTEQKECHYGPDGKVQKTPLGSPAAAAQSQPAAGGRRGRLKEHVIEKKVDEMKDYMERVSALVHEYVPPDPQKIQAAVAAGNFAVQPDSSGVAALSFRNYLKQGDSLAIGFDSASKKISSYNVQSYLDDPQKDVVTLAVTFDSLPDGTNYPAKTLLNAKAKQIEVQVTNANYKKAGM